MSRGILDDLARLNQQHFRDFGLHIPPFQLNAQADEGVFLPRILNHGKFQKLASASQ